MSNGSHSKYGYFRRKFEYTAEKTKTKRFFNFNYQYHKRQKNLLLGTIKLASIKSIKCVSNISWKPAFLNKVGVISDYCQLGKFVTKQQKLELRT